MPDDTPERRQRDSHPRRRKRDKTGPQQTGIGLLLLVGGFILFWRFQGWEPLIPIVIGAGFFDAHVVLGLVKRWRSSDKANDA